MAYLLRQQKTSRSVGRMLLFTAAWFGVWSISPSGTSAQQVRPRYPLTSAQVVDEMQSHQLPTQGVLVGLAVPITTAVANPPLEIQSVSLLNPHEVRLRITCRDHSACLPFFATATYPRGVNSTSLITKPNDRAVARLVPVSAPRAIGVARTAVPEVKPAFPAEPPMLRSGSPATLDLDQDRVHIRIEVICLESGAAGDKVRVTSRDRKQTYLARIVTPTLLKGNF